MIDVELFLVLKEHLFIQGVYFIVSLSMAAVRVILLHRDPLLLAIKSLFSLAV
jgi:hypothetical protein